MDSRVMTKFLRLLNDRDFVTLKSAFMHNPIPWDEFRQMAMPQDLTPRQAWELIAAIDHSAGFPCASASPAVDTCWYMITPHMSETLFDIEARCRTDSPLSQALLKRVGRGCVTQPLVDEILACAHRDGLSLDYEAVRDLIAENRKPQNDPERIISNVQRLLLDHRHLESETTSPERIAELGHLIAENAEGFVANAKLNRIAIADPDYVDSRTALEWISAWMRNTSPWPESHAAITAIGIAGSFWSLQPLPQWNALVELLVRRVFLEHRGYLALAYVPLSALEFEWEQGHLNRPAVFAPFGEAWLKSQAGGDQTPYVSTMLDLMHRGLDALEETIRSLELRDQNLRLRIEKDARINHRQRQILEQALATLGSVFSIAEHARSHAIALSTARCDLFDLVEMGLLRLEREGSKSLFRACPDLRVLLENRKPPRLLG